MASNMWEESQIIEGRLPVFNIRKLFIKKIESSVFDIRNSAGKKVQYWIIEIYERLKVYMSLNRDTSVYKMLDMLCWLPSNT